MAKRRADFEIIRQGQEEIMRIDANSWSYSPSIEDSGLVMANAIDRLVQVPSVARLIFNQRKNYEYGYKETQMLVEVANLYNHLTKQKKILSLDLLGYEDVARKHAILKHIVFNLLRTDPIGAYVEIKRTLREERIGLKGAVDIKLVQSIENYISVLEYILGLMEQMHLIKIIKDKVAGYVLGERTLYKQIFRVNITPDFMYTKLMARIPVDVDIVDSYSIGSSDVNVYRVKDDVKLLYHVTPPEFKLTEDEYMLINLARSVLSEHKPKEEEFLEPDKMRTTFFNIGKDLIMELCSHRKVDIEYERIEMLAEILVRYTVGFGMVEILLQDPKIHDVVVNAPIGQTKMFIVHADYGECFTNIIPSSEDGESWATKFRLLSGRPLDEANPVLDTELSIDGGRARVAVIGRPLSPQGLGYAFRRHRDMPWTLPLFISNRMINSMCAGILSFLIDGARTILVAGTRSSGKCVDGDTLIQLADGSIKKIKSLIGKKKKKINDGFIYEPVSNLKVDSLKEMIISDKKITDVWKRESPEKVVRIKTKTGKEIITTSEHPYFIYSNGLKNIRADKLSRGDLIASPRILKTFGKDVFINLRDMPEFRSETEDYFVLKGRTNSLEIKFPKEITLELAEFIGMIIGDGHLCSSKLEFHNSNKSLRERYISLVKMFGLPYREFKSHSTSVVQITSRVLNKILNKVFEIPFGKKADKVVIPQLILKSNNDVLAGFLRGYFDTDGYVAKNRRIIELISASRMMSEHLRMALLRFGITVFTKLKEIDGVYYFRNSIYSDNLKKFENKIGFFHPAKKNRLNYILSKSCIKNTNTDIIPDGNKIFKKLRKKLRISPKMLRDFGKDYWSYETNKHRITRNWFKKITKFYRERFNSLCLMKEQIDLLKEFCEFNYYDYFDKIEKLRKFLGLSYATLAVDLGFSDVGLRKCLQKSKTVSIDTFEKVTKLVNLLEAKINDVSSLENLSINVENVPVFVEKGVVSYAQISRNTGIPESTLKYYCSSSNVPDERKNLIECELNRVKKKALLSIEECTGLIAELCSFKFTRECVNTGIILSNFKNALCISNEEFVCNNVSLTTVTNFFSGRQTFNFRTLQSMTKTIVSAYNSVINEDVLNLLLEAEKLANSDIFWDEICSIELINKTDSFVYDLTVEDTHNFVANGFIAHNTSLLGSLLVEIMRKYRIITIEDTQELSVDKMRELGYNIQSMKVRSAVVSGGNEIAADEGIRTALRLGDSSLIIGEVRSLEAKALYEAMRVGALANVVAGTIHGDSPYGVYDRVVNDLQVPKTSFKATDLIIICNPVKSPDGLHTWKRVVRITEVRKHWQEDPLAERGFVDLMVYNPKTDTLEPTADLMNGNSEIIKGVAGGVKEWSGDWNAVWNNILLRSKMKQALVDYSLSINNKKLLEADFSIKANDEFHRLSEEVSSDLGELNLEEVYKRWDAWLKSNG